ncbi:hypothetical protein RA20_12585 [Leisingera sp. ANG-Vp]|nr:hypothetical protein RA20_12585 [Leisingera sp. ANG-Vp]
MTRIGALACFCLGLAAGAEAGGYDPGFRQLEVPATENRPRLQGFLWYPAEDSRELAPIHDSKVWEPVPVAKGATPAAGRFPLVVLSHGLYGNALNQSWLAAALARQGFAVAAISHPGTSTWSRDPELSRQLWQRPRDISRLIDYLLSAPETRGLTDPQRIYMAGHSLGGFTAALLAGARYDAEGLERFCTAAPDDLVCSILNGWQVAQTPEDRQEMEADLSDPRIKAFALFDLGGTQSFAPESLAAIRRPLLIFGAPVMNSGLTLDRESRTLAAALPASGSRYIEPETLAHFDFLGQCKPGGFEILAHAEPGDEIICAGGGAERAAKHQQIIAEVAAFFSQP